MTELNLQTRPEDSAEDPLPLPGGTPVYESLTSRFVAFDRMLQTLADSGYSGFVRMLAPGSSGVLLFRNGRIVDALHRDTSTLAQGDAALSAIERQAQDGAAILDIVNLHQELVDGLHQLASGRPDQPDMRASWINAQGLVRFLQDRRYTGALSVRGNAGAGVIVFDAGEVRGSFTTESQSMANDPSEVLALWSDPEARIELHAVGPDGGPSAVSSARAGGMPEAVANLFPAAGPSPAQAQPAEAAPGPNGAGS
jgi:hypothetical protein